MKYRFINFPRYMPIERYDAAVEKVCDLLVQQQGLLSIYQVGSIGHPGISDIDLIAVFKDGSKCDADPLSCLPRDERRLFTHNVFGIAEGFFRELPRYSFFKDFLWRWGAAFAFAAESHSDALKRQVALEYLLANYMARTRDKLYGVLSVRNLLLSCSAIAYDLELLNVWAGGLYDNVRELKAMRHDWFDCSYSADQIQAWFASFYSNLHGFLLDYLKKNKLWVPEIRDYRFSRNIYMIPDQSPGYELKGIILPAFITRFHKKLRKMNELINRIDVHIPMTDCTTGEPGILAQRDALFRRMLKRHRNDFPYFTPLANNLQVKLLV